MSWLAYSEEHSQHLFTTLPEKKNSGSTKMYTPDWRQMGEYDSYCLGMQAS